MRRDINTDMDSLRTLLTAVANGSRSIESALSELSVPSGLRASDHATTDLDRKRRMGIPEVIYGAGKTADQIIEILTVLSDANQAGLVTRILPDHIDKIRESFPKAILDDVARCALLGSPALAENNLGTVAVVSAGTSDLSIAAEAVFCLKAFGNEVNEYRDVGVSGLHRLLQIVEALQKAHVVITIAGFEAALPTVLGGLIDRPIVAVPTSVGYGTSFGGLTALLGMLNSCAPGVSVVNIDNGFGAAYAATQINRKPRFI